MLTKMIIPVRLFSEIPLEIRESYSDAVTVLQAVAIITPDDGTPHEYGIVKYCGITTYDNWFYDSGVWRKQEFTTWEALLESML